MTKSGYTCIRYILCWLNILIWVAGCGILGVGIWLKIAYEGYASLLPQYALLSADSLAMAIGTLMFILSFFACCGSWFQNRCMLITYFSLVVLMFFVEFIVGSLAFVFRQELAHTLREELQNGLQHHYNITAKGPNSLITIWDSIQSKFKCCGVDSYVDWFLIDAWPQNTWTPDSCCLPAIYAKDCGRIEMFNNEKLSTTGGDYYPDGCYSQISMWFLHRLHIVGVVCLFGAFIQLFGIISSMLLFCTVKHKRTSRTYKSYQP